MDPLFCPRLSRRRAFLALLGAVPATYGGRLDNSWAQQHGGNRTWAQ